MKNLEFKDTEDNSVVKAYISDDVERVSPTEYYARTQLETKKDLLKTVMIKANPELKNLSDDFWNIEAAKIVSDLFKDIQKTKVPNNFLSLLKSSKKSEQISLMKGQNINVNELFSLLINAEKEGYTFSEYHYQGIPANINAENLPQMIHIKEDGQVKKIGETSLSDGQLKAVIEQGKKIVAKVLDRGNEWHCLYLTYRGLAGKESGVQGQRPHVHYISDKFGLSREEIVQKIKNGECPTSAVHIGILDYPSE